MTRRKKGILRRGLFWVILLAGLWLVMMYVYRTEVCNFSAYDGDGHGVYVYPGTDMDSLTTLLQKEYDLHWPWAWKMECKRLGFKQPKPGYYRLRASEGNKQLIRRLQLGQETPIKLTFTNQIRDVKQLAGRIGSVLLLDSAEVIERLQDESYMAQYGLKRETALCLFIPNTYEVYWSTSADGLFERMHKEYEHFWTDERRQKAKNIGLTPTQVSILASIVESETNHREEHPIIASLYLNRLRKGMHLQACPTVIFATGDYSMHRVLKRHLEIESPYNTYKYAGLPPGPIRAAKGVTMDAVLNAPRTPYLYMCANPNFSGTHIFSTNYNEHARAARAYQHELNERKIR